MKSMVKTKQMLAMLVFVTLIFLGCKKEDPKPLPPTPPKPVITITASAAPSAIAFGAKSKITVMVGNAASSTISLNGIVLKTGGAGYMELETADAATYAIGDVYITGNINGGSYLPGGTIVVDGSITNNNPYAGGVPAYLSASTNGSTQTVVSQTLSPGGTAYGVGYFTAPPTSGSYNVAFSAGANIPAVEQIVISASITSGPSIYYPQDRHGTGRCVVVVYSSRPASQGISMSVVVRDGTYQSFLQAVNLFLPAGQTQSNVYVMEPSSPMSSSGWCDKDLSYLATITSFSPANVDGMNIITGESGQLQQ